MRIFRDLLVVLQHRFFWYSRDQLGTFSEGFTWLVKNSRFRPFLANITRLSTRLRLSVPPNKPVNRSNAYKCVFQEQGVSDATNGVAPQSHEVPSDIEAKATYTGLNAPWATTSNKPTFPRSKVILSIDRTSSWNFSSTTSSIFSTVCRFMLEFDNLSLFVLLKKPRNTHPVVPPHLQSPLGLPLHLQLLLDLPLSLGRCWVFPLTCSRLWAFPFSLSCCRVFPFTSSRIRALPFTSSHCQAFPFTLSRCWAFPFTSIRYYPPPITAGPSSPPPVSA